uniref:Tetraspanin n=1 Tax=Naja naja TaxID=35670 RepID=A0A8C6VK91_NAJNA
MADTPKKSISHHPKGIMAVLKLFLMAFSFVFWAAGLTMLTIGIWAKISLGTYLMLSTNQYPPNPFILLAAGITIIVWGFLGCFSAATEHRCLLRLSSLFYRENIAEGFQNGLREALDFIQRNLNCCGIESYRDWFSSPWSVEQQAPNGSVPVSCCRTQSGCLHAPLPSDARGIYQNGCFSKVHDFVSYNMFYIASAALGLALMQVVGIILSCLLAARILPQAESSPRNRTCCFNRVYSEGNPLDCNLNGNPHALMKSLFDIML